MKIAFEKIDVARLSPQSRWSLENLALPQVEEELDVPALAERYELKPRIVKKMLDELYAEIRAQQHGAVIPELAARELETLTESIRLHGLLYPILIDERTGKRIDGGNRERICTELNIEPEYRYVRSRNDEHARALALSANLARRQLDPRRMRKLAQAEILRDPSRSDRAIAELLGTHGAIVGRARRDLEKLGVVPQVLHRIGMDNSAQSAAKAKPAARPHYRVVVYGPSDTVLFDRACRSLAEARAIDLASELADREE